MSRSVGRIKSIVSTEAVRIRLCACAADEAMEIKKYKKPKDYEELKKHRIRQKLLDELLMRVFDDEWIKKHKITKQDDCGNCSSKFSCKFSPFLAEEHRNKCCTHYECGYQQVSHETKEDK